MKAKIGSGQLNDNVVEGSLVELDDQDISKVVGYILAGEQLITPKYRNRYNPFAYDKGYDKLRIVSSGI